MLMGPGGAWETQKFGKGMLSEGKGKAFNKGSGPTTGQTSPLDETHTAYGNTPTDTGSVNAGQDTSSSA